ncbi:EIN4 protein [Nymphaea thermarum]|nr:EIN4 protein [Nymphaea thermarum]
MLTLGQGLVVISVLLSVSVAHGDFPRCNCDDDSLWGIENILQCQKVSDLLIALAYFSIPLELLYFISCANVFPFKWVLVQFGAFIVLCGLTHLLTVWTYAPHSFHLMLALTIFKLLTALVSCATAITLVTLIPQLLRVKVREVFLKQKAQELNREVGMMKRQEETSWHVRMLTQEIRKSLDRHTILQTTLVELSKTLLLQNCAVWMPNAQKTEMVLMYEYKNRNLKLSVPIADPDIIDIWATKEAKILTSNSSLGSASSCGSTAEKGVAAIRMPMLRVSNFKGGTPEFVEACYAILVLVLPGETSHVWSDQELEIVEVVADQVAVALSHAAVLEESQLMREELEAQNRALQLARRNAMMASQARNSFQKVMSHGMRRPMYTISGLLSVIQFENLDSNQRLIVDMMAKTGSVLSKLINDVMEISTADHGGLSLELHSFQLHPMIKEVAALAKCLCSCRGYDFEFGVGSSVPDQVIGDEKRIFQVILHMVGNMISCGPEEGLSLSCSPGQGLISFRAYVEDENEASHTQRWSPWKPEPLSNGYVYVKFEFRNKSNLSNKSSSGTSQLTRKVSGEGSREGLGFTMCKKLVQRMQGNIWVVSGRRGPAESMTLLLKLRPQQTIRVPTEPGSSELLSRSILKGLNILVADGDSANLTATRKILEKLGCRVSVVGSGFDCLNALACLSDPWDPIRVVILDIYMAGMDGCEVAHRIRKSSGLWPLIVALTASTDDDIQEKCLQVGINGIIRKPVLLEAMADELTRIIHQGGPVV